MAGCGFSSKFSGSELLLDGGFKMTPHKLSAVYLLPGLRPQGKPHSGAQSNRVRSSWQNRWMMVVRSLVPVMCCDEWRESLVGQTYTK
jgi:hypothetical protein